MGVTREVMTLASKHYLTAAFLRYCICSLNIPSKNINEPVLKSAIERAFVAGTVK